MDEAEVWAALERGGAVQRGHFAEAEGHADLRLGKYNGLRDPGGAEQLAVALAERLAAPVWAAPAPERAVFPEDHPHFRGVLPYAIGPLSEALRGHDTVLVVGAPVFRYYPHVPGDYLPDGARLLHVTDDPEEAVSLIKASEREEFG
jgi:benzoylformate decarboxylase